MSRSKVRKFKKVKMAKPPEQPPRLRLSKHIDLTKANPDCKRCHGKGVIGHKRLRLDEIDGGDGSEERVPIICRCITRRGGVKEDALDQICRQMKKDIDDGVFPRNLANDIKNMDPENRANAIQQLVADLGDPRKSKEAKDATRAALEFIGGDAVN